MSLLGQNMSNQFRSQILTYIVYLLINLIQCFGHVSKAGYIKET